MFEKFRMIMPKLKEQFITPKQAYLARTDDTIVIKVDRSCVFVLKSDGTYEIGDIKKVKEYLK